METKTDSFVVQSSRLRESTKELYNIIIDHYNLTHEEFMRQTLDMWLEKMSPSFISRTHYPNKKYPFLENKDKILMRIKVNRR